MRPHANREPRDTFTHHYRKQTMKIGFLAATTALTLTISFAGHARAASRVQGVQHTRAPAMSAHAGMSLQSRLFTSPTVVQVGQQVTISVVAPVPSNVRISFNS